MYSSHWKEQYATKKAKKAKKKKKNTPTLLLFHGEKLWQDHVQKCGRIKCVPQLHHVLQNTTGRDDFLLCL